MPTVFEKDGIRYFFYSADGKEPRHVHVEYGEGKAKYWLEPVSLASSYRMKGKDLKRARQAIEDNAQRIKEKWDEYFGTNK